jgi:hypothetical protein
MPRLKWLRTILDRPPFSKGQRQSGASWVQEEPGEIRTVLASISWQCAPGREYR